MISAQDAQDKELVYDADYTKHIRFAKVTEVFDSLEAGQEDNYGKVSLMWLDTLVPVHGTVSYLKPGYSILNGYGIVVVPSVGDIAACYTLSSAPPIILGFYSRSQFAAVTAAQDNTDNVGSMEHLVSGEVLIKGKSQSSIILKRDGRVNISVKNGNDTTTVVNQDQRRTSVKFNEKSSNSPENTVVDVSLGLTDVLAGPGRQVISCTTGPSQIYSVELKGEHGVLSYSLGSLSGVDIVGISEVRIYLKGANGELNLQEVLDRNSKVSLSATYYYNTGIGNELSKEDPCTMDTNGVVASITLPPSVTGLLENVNTIIQVDLFIKRPKFSLKVNEFGDLIVNCRNAVINAEDNKSQLGVLSDSRIIANAVHTELGNKLTGCVITDRGGVINSAGTFTNADIETVKPSGIQSVTQDVMYFYIVDEFPLIAYTATDKVNTYRLVDVSEYNSLDKIERSKIFCKPFDYTKGGQTVDGFTRTKLDALMKDAYRSGKAIVSYKELKAL